MDENEKYFMTLLKRVKWDLKASHIGEDYLLEVVENLKKSKGKNLNITGSSLSYSQKQDLKKCMVYCRSVYTDHSVHDASSIGSLTERKKANKLKRLRARISEHCSSLQSIIGKYHKSLALDGFQVTTGTLFVVGQQAPTLELRKHLAYHQSAYDEWRKTVNLFLEEIGRDPINYEKIEMYELSQKRLQDLQEEHDLDYSLYWKTSVSGVEELSDEANVLFKFMGTAKLRDTETRKYTALGVFFRNRSPPTGLGARLRSACLKPLKDNPVSSFDGKYEVDHVVLLEEDLTELKMDRLVFVFSGSNSLRDWVANTDFGAYPFHGISAHQGICKIVDDSESSLAQSNLMTRLENFYKYRRNPTRLDVIFTGHSLGGALAMLTAYYNVKHNDFEAILGAKVTFKTITFGTPPVIDPAAQTLIEQTLGLENIFRVWTFDDRIVRLSDLLPDSVLQGAVHIGQSCPLYNIHGLKTNTLGFTDSHQANCYQSYLGEVLTPSELSKSLIVYLKGYCDKQVDEDYLAAYAKWKKHWVVSGARAVAAEGLKAVTFLGEAAHPLQMTVAGGLGLVGGMINLVCDENFSKRHFLSLPPEVVMDSSFLS